MDIGCIYTRKNINNRSDNFISADPLSQNFVNYITIGIKIYDTQSHYLSNTS